MEVISVSDTDQNRKHFSKDSLESVQQEREVKSKVKAQSEKKAAEKNRPQKTGKGAVFFAVLISFCALGFSGYIAWRAMPLELSQPILREGVDQLQIQVVSQQAELSSLAENTSVEIGKQSELLYELQQREARLLSRVDTLSSKVVELEGTSRNHWRMAEIEYLLRLASQRLLMVSDISGALNLMVSADEILRQLDDYSLLPVREALAEDMAVLRGTSSLSQEDVWLRLQAVAYLIPDLVTLDDSRISDISTTEFTAPAAKDELGELPSNGTWQHKFKILLIETWHNFTNLFHINNQREQAIKPLLTQEQDQIIRQRMLLLVEQSKFGLVTEKQIIYQNSLKQVSNMLNQYFILGGKESQQLAAELVELEKLSVTSKAPQYLPHIECVEAASI